MRARGKIRQNRAHIFHPNRQRRGRSGFAPAKISRLVKADKHRGNDIAVEAGKPSVAEIVGGAGFARKIFASQGQGAPAGAGANDLAQHIAD